jgi:hypothetical protein
MSFCSVANKDRTKFSCFSADQIKNIVRAYNSSYPDKIKINQPIEDLWKDLRRNLSSLCDTEDCWLGLPFFKNNHLDTLEENFMPPGPTNQIAGTASGSSPGGNKWLSTFNIDNVMHHFEKKYPDFTFFGPVPIDFAQILTELNNLNLKRLYKNGTRRIGIVFNFDPHTKPGSHWVALMVDLNTPGTTPNSGKIAFFDSYGHCPPPKEISTLIQTIWQDAYTNLGMQLEILCNKTRHQFSSSECGVYSIYFIEESLGGKSFMQIFSDIMTDDDIVKKRSKYFRPER